MNSKLKSLRVHTTQGMSGVLVRESQIIFNYETNERDCEIGLTMPLSAKSYASSILPGPLRQNLPEGFLRHWIEQHFGKTMKIDDLNIMGLVGHDMIGRVLCSAGSEGQPPAQGEDLAELLAWRGTEELFEHLSNKYASMSGISGVQPKVLVPQKTNVSNDVVEKTSIKDATYIVKAAGADYDGLTENEYHCMSIAQRAGLVVPRFWLSDDKGLFIVERFDRGSNDDYLGFEDMTSLTGRQNSEKYEGSYEMVAKAVSMFSAKRCIPESLCELFKSIVLSVVVRNGDAHLKNFGMLYTHPAAGDARLSPLYDIVNTTIYIPKDLLALKMDKKRNWPDRETLIEFGRNHCQLARPADIIEKVCDAANEYKPNIESGPVWDLIRPLIDAACFSLSDGKTYSLPKGKSS